MVKKYAKCSAKVYRQLHVYGIKSGNIAKVVHVIQTGFSVINAKVI